MIASLLIAHLVGDFLLQNDWMQTKSKNSFACSIHVFMYSIPFIGLSIFGGLEWWLFAAIICEHWIQDRFALHLKWMKFYRQTPPEKWAVGPLCMDQSMHLGFIGLLCAI